MASPHLTREDVIFGRAVLAFQMLTREQLDACLAQHHELGEAGQKKTLAAVVVSRGLLNADQYRQLVEAVRARYAPPPASDMPVKPAAPEVAAQAIPDITKSGNYRDAVQKPEPYAPAPHDSGIRKVVDRFERVAEQLVDAGSKIDLKATHTGTPVPGAAKVEPAPAVKTKKHEKVDFKKELAATDRAPADEALRKKLRVKGDAETFDFGPYEVTRFLGAGSIGVVYEAVHEDGRKVALKVLGTFDQGDKALRRFLQERRIVKDLEHPGIVRVLEAGIERELPYFTMELVEGRSLADVLKAERPAREVLLAAVARICDAVAMAHDRGIVHRGLEPKNILVRAADGEPLITDFGLAKELGSELKLTVAGVQIGTAPAYTAPEVQMDPGAATVQSDVYSLGSIIFEATAGRTAFTARTPGEFLEKMMTQDAPSPSSIDPASPKALDAICGRALARDPKGRYASARALAQDLERALKGELPGATREKLGILGRIATTLRLRG